MSFHFLINRARKITRADLLTQILLKRTIKGCVCYTSGTLLDIGCGRKPYLEVFLGHVDTYWCMDLPQEVRLTKKNKMMPKGLRESLDRLNIKINPDVYATALALPIRENSINVVLATEVLEHLPSPTVFLKEVRRVLKPGGRLVLTTPFVWFLHEVPYDYFRYTRWGLESLLNNNEFKPLVVEPYGDTATTIGSLISLSLSNTIGMHCLSIIPVRLLCLLIQGVSYLIGRAFRGNSLPFGHLAIAEVIK